MNLTKKHYAMLIAGAVVLFLVYWFFFRKKKTESSYDPNLLIYGSDSGYGGAYGVGMNGGARESGYAGVYGSTGGESGYSALQLDAAGLESGFSLRRGFVGKALQGPIPLGKETPWKGSTSGTWYCPVFEDGVWKDKPCKMKSATT